MIPPFPGEKRPSFVPLSGTTEGQEKSRYLIGMKGF